MGVFHQQNITVLIGGSQLESHACSLSTVTGIPLVRLYERLIPFNQCDKTVDMSVDYRDFAHATFDVLASFHWRKISLVFDGNQECLRPHLFRGKLPWMERSPLHEKLDLHKFARGKCGAKKCKLGENQRQRE